jgi:hypothetical protein
MNFGWYWIEVYRTNVINYLMYDFYNCSVQLAGIKWITYFLSGVTSIKWTRGPDEL